MKFFILVSACLIAMTAFIDSRTLESFAFLFFITAVTCYVTKSGLKSNFVVGMLVVMIPVWYALIGFTYLLDRSLMYNGVIK